MSRVSVSKKRYAMRFAPLISIYLAIGLTLGCLSFLAPETEAATTYWMSVAPPSKNATYERTYGHYHYEQDDFVEGKINSDELIYDLYGTVSYSHSVEANDFTNDTEWIEVPDEEGWVSVGWMPPNDATLIGVYVIANFSSYYPSTYLKFSTTGGSSWTTSSIYYAGLRVGGQWSIIWNVTSLATWTPALLNSTSTWARADMYPLPNTHYYLDYVGFFVTWCGDYVGGGGGDEYEEGIETDYESWFLATNIVSILGFVGLIGVIAAPALAIYMYRHGNEGRIPIFVKMLAYFMISLSMFMFSLAA